MKRSPNGAVEKSAAVSAVKPTDDPLRTLEFKGFQLLLEGSLKCVPTFWDATADYPEDAEWVRQMVKDTRCDAVLKQWHSEEERLSSLRVSRAVCVHFRASKAIDKVHFFSVAWRLGFC
jgi:hypothetical protein